MYPTADRLVVVYFVKVISHILDGRSGRVRCPTREEGGDLAGFVYVNACVCVCVHCITASIVK